MPQLQQQTLIQAAPEVIFALLDDPERLPEYMPGVQRTGDCRHTDRRIGDWVDVIYALWTLEVPIKVYVVAYDRPEHLGLRLDGRVAGTLDWQLSAQPEGSSAVVTLAYQVTGGGLTRTMSTLLIERLHAPNLDRLLENVKRLTEPAC